MHKILGTKELAENIFLIKVEAEAIAKKAKPGHFIILRINETGERIPLTIADHDDKTITLVVQAIGHTTKKLSNLKVNENIQDIAGPLGTPSHIEKVGTVCLVAGGVGCAEIYPIAKEFKKQGNKVIIIFGARSKELLFWEEEFNTLSDELIICTNDGSKGIKGFVTQPLEELIKTNKPDLIMAVGPLPMMKAVTELTKNKVKTLVSLNSIMIDGTGMCGGCRVTIKGKPKFVCVDGPEFNAEDIDFNEIMKRNSTYKKEEEHMCKIGR
jgi:ferredoxin/flavodoxin---NADP+ reductase